MASGHPDTVAGHTDVAEECQEVDEEVEGEVDGGHVEVEGQGGQSRLLLQLRSSLHGIQLSCHPGCRRRGVGIEGRYYGWCTGRLTLPTARQSLQTFARLSSDPLIACNNYVTDRINRFPIKVLPQAMQCLIFEQVTEA